jgi:cytochrome P450
MMALTIQATDTTRIPDDIAAAALLPESYLDEENRSYPAFKWIRENNPFGRAYVEGYDPLWLATKRDDILEIELKPEIFCMGRDEPGVNDKASAAFLKKMRGDGRTIDTLAYMDPPDHTTLKSVINHWFMPAAARKREDQIRPITKAAVDHLLSIDGEVDLVKDLALYYPLRVVMSLMGVPQEDEEMILKFSTQHFGAADPEQQQSLAGDPEARGRVYREANQGFFDYFDELAAERRKNPADDLTSLVANAKVDGKPLPQTWVHGFLMSIAAAGHDTTSATIAGTLHAFAKFPKELEKARQDLSLIPSVVEEAIRYVSPVKHFQKTVTQDIEFRGRQLREGDRVLTVYASANRDEELFENPNDFNVTRQQNKHVGFGYGIHMCLGQHVAKVEMRLLLEELLPQIDAVEVTGEPQYVETNFITGHKSLPARLHKV